MLETIQQAVKHHDKYQIEIKLDYELLAAEQTRYNISTYIFVPQNLGITPESYPKHYFYRDVQSYIRLKTPSLNLREISDSERSPLCQVESLVRRADWTGEPDCHERVSCSPPACGRRRSRGSTTRRSSAASWPSSWAAS